jgi:hypothetical protein
MCVRLHGFAVCHLSLLLAAMLRHLTGWMLHSAVCAVRRPDEPAACGDNALDTCAAAVLDLLSP